MTVECLQLQMDPASISGKALNCLAVSQYCLDHPIPLGNPCVGPRHRPADLIQEFFRADPREVWPGKSGVGLTDRASFAAVLL